MSTEWVPVGQVEVSPADWVSDPLRMSRIYNARFFRGEAKPMVYAGFYAARAFGGWRVAVTFEYTCRVESTGELWSFFGREEAPALHDSLKETEEAAARAATQATLGTWSFLDWDGRPDWSAL